MVLGTSTGLPKESRWRELREAIGGGSESLSSDSLHQHRSPSLPGTYVAGNGTPSHQCEGHSHRVTAPQGLEHEREAGSQETVSKVMLLGTLSFLPQA